MRRRAGLTLLEVLLALLLLTLTVWVFQATLVGLMRGTTRADNHQEAVAALQTVCDLFRHRARQNWPSASAYGGDPVVVVDGEHLGYIYHVTDYGRVHNPLQPSAFLEVKRLKVELEYQIHNAQGVDERQRLSTYVSACR